MKCPSCGKELRDGAKFCDECGFSLVAQELKDKESESDAVEVSVTENENNAQEKQDLVKDGLNLLSGFASSAGKASKDFIDSASKYAIEVGLPAAQQAADAAIQVTQEKIIPSVQEVSGKAVGAIKDTSMKAAEEAMKALDANGDGKVDLEDIIIIALRVPGVAINRATFLKNELSKNYKPEVVEDAIKFNPAHAGITVEEIDKIADQVIEYERRNVTGISAALGVPGGVAIVATLPTDIAQYYGFMLRAMQKLMYLYGWPELDASGDNVGIDSETMNLIMLCLGVMYGVGGASSALKVASNALGKGVEKKLINTALTKGTIYPIVKSVAKWFNVRMTKEVFAGFFKKAIPVIGGVVGGGLTYVSFKPCCVKLKNSLRNTLLSNPNSQDTMDIDDLALDAEFSETE